MTSRRFPTYRVVVYLLLVSTLGFTACSPVYVLRAGIEEAIILKNRVPIDDILASEETDADIRAMLVEVRRARGYAQELGLDPKGSFSYYTAVDRDVLVWVLSAAPKNKLEFKTWWFPIVGRVPYKGFFEKEDGLAKAREYAADGFDTVLRPSLAFSTLGWFDDPLLSTMRKVDRIALVDTVFHELLHNTLWLPNHVEFNESLANAIGGLTAIEYFRTYYGPLHPFTTEAQYRWRDEVRYSLFLAQLIEKLRQFYRDNEKTPLDTVIKLRKDFFLEQEKLWTVEREKYESNRFKTSQFEKNNAALLSQTIYSSHLDDFDAVYALQSGDWQKFLDAMKELVKRSKSQKRDPFELLLELRQSLSRGIQNETEIKKQ